MAKIFRFIPFLFPAILATACSDSTNGTALEKAPSPAAVETASAVDPDPANTRIPAATSMSTLDMSGGPHAQHNPHARLDPGQMIKVALQHETEGRHALALKTLDEAIEKHPDTAQLYGVRASLLLQDKQLSGALSDLEKAIQLNPDDAGLRINRALIYRSFGRYEEAMQDLDFAVEKAPDFLAAYFNRGALHYAREDYDAALSDFEQCIALAPHSAAPYFNRGSTYWQLGKPAEAIGDMEHFIELEKNPEWQKSARDLLEKWNSALSASNDGTPSGTSGEKNRS